MKVAGCVVLYNPNLDFLNNIKTYIDALSELIVFDNSTQQNIEIVESLKNYEKVKYLSEKKNLGIATALNICIKHIADTDVKWVLTMDQDSYFKKNEIDIIVQQNDTTAFVEVKARTTDNKGNPEQFVTPAKQAEIKKAANQYIYDNETNKVRFDVIAITYWPDAETELIHFEDAFW